MAIVIQELGGNNIKRSITSGGGGLQYSHEAQIASLDQLFSYEEIQSEKKNNLENVLWWYYDHDLNAPSNKFLEKWMIKWQF